MEDRYRIRILVCGLIIVLTSAMLVARLYQLQILQGNLTSTVGLPTGQAVLVYPNPVRAGQPLEVVAQVELPAAFSVYNVQGQLVYQQTLVQQQVSLTPNLASGTYTYRLTGAKKMYTGNLVIIH